MSFAAGAFTSGIRCQDGSRRQPSSMLHKTMSTIGSLGMNVSTPVGQQQQQQQQQLSDPNKLMRKQATMIELPVRFNVTGGELTGQEQQQQSLPTEQNLG